MYEHIYLKNISTKQIIVTLNRDGKIMDNSTKETFEKLITNNNEDEQKEIKSKLNKFQTEKIIFYFSVKNGLFTGISTTETSNEKIYDDLIADIMNDEKFIMINDVSNDDKKTELLKSYVSKHFKNPNTLKMMGDSIENAENGEGFKTKQTVDLYFPENDEEDDKKSGLKMPKGHISKKNWKLCFFVCLLIIGIGVVAVLINVIPTDDKK